MGTCWNCGKDVFLKDEETRCTNCKQIIRYWCNSCKQPFDVQDKETKKKITECKWCGFFKCPNCNGCGPTCSKFEHLNFIKRQIIELIPIDKYPLINKRAQKIVDYFEDIKMGRDKTTCDFGVPKTYAKERIKSILARMKGYRVRDEIDQTAFEKRHEEVLYEEIGHEFTIGNTRDNGTYGQEYRDVFNLCVCIGKLEYEKKYFINDKGIEVSYDSWTRIEETQCPYLDVKELIVKKCPKCKKIYSRDERYCNECTYPKGGKNHEKDSHFELVEELSNNPTCKNLSNFKKMGGIKEDGESESESEGNT